MILLRWSHIALGHRLGRQGTLLLGRSRRSDSIGVPQFSCVPNQDRTSLSSVQSTGHRNLLLAFERDFLSKLSVVGVLSKQCGFLIATASTKDGFCLDLFSSLLLLHSTRQYQHSSNSLLALGIDQLYQHLHQSPTVTSINLHH